MRNIALIGGMASGKTTLANKLCCSVPQLSYIYASIYTVRIPLTLIHDKKLGAAELLSLPKQKYIDTILANEDVAHMSCPRERMDRYGLHLICKYGETIIADIALAVANGKEPVLLDNVARAQSVHLLKEKGFYVVGLHCSFENQVKRRLEQSRDIDSTEKSALEEQIKKTNTFFQVNASLKLADKVYNTDKYRSDSPRIVRDIIESAK